MKATGKNIFEQLSNKWQRNIIFEAIILSACLIIPSIVIAWYFFNEHFFWITSISVLIGSVILSLYFFLKKPTTKDVLTYLDQAFPQLEFSSFLLLKDQTKLNIIESLQLEKVSKKYASIATEIDMPLQIKSKLYLLAVIVLASFGISFFSNGLQSNIQPNLVNESILPDTLIKKVANKSLEVPVISKVNVKIDPPNYTNLKTRNTNNLDLLVPTQSKLTWSFEFSEVIKEAKLQFTDGQLFQGIQNGKNIKFNWEATSNNIYQIIYSDKNEQSYKSNYYKIEVIEDRKPQISINELPQYQTFDEGAEASFDVKATISDDYGITEASIVATISKGSGESVKFREERIELTDQFKRGSKTISLIKNLNLYQMEADAGDELYFYLEVADNRYPNPQKQRTETYFALLKDSTQEVVAVESGLGVDFMPEYFRSQRQLIIDTEKLIAQRGKIPTKEFNDTSNNIGYDQKVLRLRYGEFLGEEFESNIGGSESVNIDDHHDHHHNHDHSSHSHQQKVNALVEEHAHLHDTQSEMERVILESKLQGHNHDHGHNHNHSHENSGPNEDEMITLNNGAMVDAEMVHAHDSEESATFYFDATKVKLKAALSLMWESELHLRMNNPEKALPIEYEILKLLKEVQQKSRIYVERIGFDTPPIKESKRLQGELDEIEMPAYANKNEDTAYLPYVREAIALLEKVRLDKVRLEEVQLENRTVVEWEQTVFQKAGNEVAALALEAPNKYLGLLKKMETLQSSNSVSADFIYKLQKQLLAILPESFHQKFETTKNKSPLEKLFLDEINSLP